MLSKDDILIVRNIDEIIAIFKTNRILKNVRNKSMNHLIIWYR